MPTRGKQGRRGDRGLKGDTGLRGDKGYSDTNEVITFLERIESKSDELSKVINSHGTDLAVIKTQVLITNGTVKKNCSDIEIINRIVLTLVGSLSTWKYIAMILGGMAATISIVAFFIKP